MLTPRLLCRTFSISRVNRSGHNKWSKIKQKKGLLDSQKSVIYGKASRDIVVAVRNGGSDDPDKNLTLAAVLKRARIQGVPKDNIEHALTKARQGSKDKGCDQNLTYEALAYNSVGVIIECLSDNTNRTIREIREILNSHGGRFASVSFMFERKGHIRVALNEQENLEAQKERLLEAALEGGAVDFEESTMSDVVHEMEFTCHPGMLSSLTTAVTASSVSSELLASELVYAPLQVAEFSDDYEMKTKIRNLIEALEAHEDTLRVWTTLAI